MNIAALQMAEYPLDAIGGGMPLSGFGTRKLFSKYTGPAVKVVNPLTLVANDIFFMPDGDMDHVALRAAMGHAAFLQVAVVYDQCGTNHLFQDNPQNRPAIHPDIRLGNSIALLFDGSKQGKVTDKYFNIPETFTTTKGQCITQLAVASFRDIAQSQGISTLHRPDHNMTWGYEASSDFFMATIYNTNVNLRIPAPVTPFVAGYSEMASGTKLWLDDASVFSGHKYRAAISGGTVGRLWAMKGGYLEIASLLIYGRSFDEAAQSAVNNALYDYFGFSPRAANVLLCDGDSITEGYGSTLNQTWPRQIMPLLRKPYRIYNTGSFGQTSKARLNYLDARWARFFPDANSRNLLVEFSGTNDLGAGLPAEAIYENFKMLVEKAHARNVKIILVTALPRHGFLSNGTAPGQHEAERTALNKMIRDNMAKADGIADIAADPVMGSYDNLESVDYYIDKIHPVSKGLLRIAETVAREVNKI